MSSHGTREEQNSFRTNFRRNSKTYHRLVQENLMTLNSVTNEGSMFLWSPRPGEIEMPCKDVPFNFEATQYISTGPNGCSICSFGLILNHECGSEFVNLRVYKCAKSCSDAKIPYGQLKLKLAFLSNATAANCAGDVNSLNPQRDISLRTDIVMNVGKRCSLNNCCCRREPRSMTMCTRFNNFMTVEELQKLIVPLYTHGGSIFYNIDILLSAELCSQPDSLEDLMGSAIEPPKASQPAHKYAMKKSLEDKLFTDVKLKVGEKLIDCHRVILSAHSDVFQTMLQTDMLEKRSGVIELIDLSYDAAVTLLSYLYCGDIERISTEPEIAFELLKAADKYNIGHLKDISRGFLLVCAVSNIDIGLALEIFGYANQVDKDASLEAKSVAIIKSKSKFLQSSEIFQNFLTENPAIATAFIIASFDTQN